MDSFLQGAIHPERYHGPRRDLIAARRSPFFEGWYYKLIDAAEQHRYAIIPGVSLGRNAETRHAFVQVLDGTLAHAAYHTYPLEQFHATPGALDVHIGPNRFQWDRISLNIDSPEQAISGEVRFSPLIPWPVRFASPGVMGWYAWVPFMECYHGVLGLDHALEGKLRVNGTGIDWDGGRGYIEKDWGRSFPRAWVWIQTNHFEQPGTSLTASVAMIPWLSSTFRGFVVGLWHGHTLYRFATYTGARIEKLEIADQQVEWTIRNRTARLQIHARRTHGGVLRGPTVADMGVRVPETLLGQVTARLSRFDGQREAILFEGTGRNAGIEVVGDVDRLLKG